LAGGHQPAARVAEVLVFCFQDFEGDVVGEFGSGEDKLLSGVIYLFGFSDFSCLCVQPFGFVFSVGDVEMGFWMWFAGLG